MSLMSSTGHGLENADSLKLSMEVFLALKKAFDRVDHKILIDTFSNTESREKKENV